MVWDSTRIPNARRLFHEGKPISVKEARGSALCCNTHSICLHPASRVEVDRARYDFSLPARPEQRTGYPSAPPFCLCSWFFFFFCLFVSFKVVAAHWNSESASSSRDGYLIWIPLALWLIARKEERGNAIGRIWQGRRRWLDRRMAILLGRMCTICRRVNVPVFILLLRSPRLNSATKGSFQDWEIEKKK